MSKSQGVGTYSLDLYQKAVSRATKDGRIRWPVEVIHDPRPLNPAGLRTAGVLPIIVPRLYKNEAPTRVNDEDAVNEYPVENL